VPSALSSPLRGVKKLPKEKKSKCQEQKSLKDQGRTSRGSRGGKEITTTREGEKAITVRDKRL